MNYYLEDCHSYSAEIPWEVQRDAFRQDALGGVGQAMVEKDIVTLSHPVPLQHTLLRCDIWIGLFGGFPSRDNALPTDSTPEWISRMTHGQVQEVTVDIYAQAPGGKRVRLWGRDLHQLTPSASFAGWAGENMPPIVLPVGTRIWMVTRTSQKDRGAHTRATVLLAEGV